jgi:hypothetical protein
MTAKFEVGKTYGTRREYMGGLFHNKYVIKSRTDKTVTVEQVAPAINKIMKGTVRRGLSVREGIELFKPGKSNTMCSARDKTA